jgi:hypothetical protein
VQGFRLQAELFDEQLVAASGLLRISAAIPDLSAVDSEPG